MPGCEPRVGAASCVGALRDFANQEQLSVAIEVKSRQGSAPTVWNRAVLYGYNDGVMM